MIDYPARFKNSTEVEAYLSLRNARDGDRRTLVQRRRTGTATQEELDLLDDIALDRVKKPMAKARDAEMRDVLAYATLLEIESQRRAGRTQQGVIDEAITRVCERFHIGRTAVKKARRQFKGARKRFALRHIKQTLDFAERVEVAAKTGAWETIRPEDLDTDASFILAPALEKSPK